MELGLIARNRWCLIAPREQTALPVQDGDIIISAGDAVKGARGEDMLKDRNGIASVGSVESVDKIFSVMLP